MAVNTVAGLDARKPSAVEVEDLIGSMPPNLIVVVGRCDLGDKKYPTGIPIEWVDGTTLNKVYDVLSNAGILRDNWHSTFAQPSSVVLG